MVFSRLQGSAKIRSDLIIRCKRYFPREARDLISKIRSCTVRSDLKNKQKTAENALFLRSDLTVQDRILEIRSLASLGSTRAQIVLRIPTRKGPNPEELVSRGNHLKWCFAPPREGTEICPEGQRCLDSTVRWKMPFWDVVVKDVRRPSKTLRT